MPRKTKPTTALPPIPKELLDQLVTGPMTPEAVQDVMMSFKKALIELLLEVQKPTANDGLTFSS